MKYINTVGLTISRQWLTRAGNKITSLINSHSDSDRFTALKAEIFSRSYWNSPSIKRVLAALSDDKCWYCETKLDRQHGDVDHYRPKGQIEDDASHPGYWWLVLSPDNFRLSCTICNQPSTHEGRPLGKRNKFPLLLSGIRARSENDNLSLERPILIDPTIKEDASLIYFDLNGIPIPAFSESTDPDKYLRAVHSINIYGLDKSDTCSKRSDRLRSVNDLLSTIMEIESAINKSPEGAVQRLNATLLRLRGRVDDVLDPSKEFSSASLGIAKTFRGQSDWLDEFFEVHQLVD